MQTQKDHVHAYQFIMRRMDTAFVTGDPDQHDTPGRRQWLGLITGLVVALLIGVGFGVYGLLKPGGNAAWKKPGAILVEKESGVRYVMVNGVLMPTRNQASAMLIQGRDATMQTISRSSLGDLPRGPMIGIPGAPDAVPSAGSLGRGTWLLCPARDGGLSVNLDETAQVANVPNDRYVPVQAPGGDMYLVWNGAKHKLPDAEALVAFGLTTTAPAKATDLWLGLIPDGPELAPARIAQAGQPGMALAGEGRIIGDLFVNKLMNGSEQRYVLQQDGLASLSATEFALLSAHADRKPVQVGADAIVSTSFSQDSTLVNRLPDVAVMRPLDAATGGACVQQSGSGADVRSRVMVARGANNWPSAGKAGALLRPTRGLFLAELPIPASQRIPNRYLITDQGRRFLLPDNDSIAALGLSGIQPVPMRTEVLSMIPAGPALTRSAVAFE